MVTRVIKIQVVTARIEEKEAFCRAQVAAGEAVAGVCLEETNIRVREGESKKLTSSVLPENAADKRVARESSDRAVAEVDAYGNVRGVSVGTALIARTGTGRRSARRTSGGEPEIYGSFFGRGKYLRETPGVTYQRTWIKTSRRTPVGIRRKFRTKTSWKN